MVSGVRRCSLEHCREDPSRPSIRLRARLPVSCANWGPPAPISRTDMSAVSPTTFPISTVAASPRVWKWSSVPVRVA